MSDCAALAHSFTLTKIPAVEWNAGTAVEQNENFFLLTLEGSSYASTRSILASDPRFTVTAPSRY